MIKLSIYCNVMILSIYSCVKKTLRGAVLN